LFFVGLEVARWTRNRGSQEPNKGEGEVPALAHGGQSLAVQQILADYGFHRARSIPDLLHAAITELNQMTVLHLDQDFELRFSITNQPVSRRVGRIVQLLHNEQLAQAYAWVVLKMKRNDRQ